MQSSEPQMELEMPDESRELSGTIDTCPHCGAHGVLKRVFNGRHIEFSVKCYMSNSRKECQLYDTPPFKSSREAVAHWKMVAVMAI